jgi:septal ring factor EnvC (AmiA/AmiB activator)
MLGKENRAPFKQGVMYELNLDKDQGPYLSKDIMHSNPRSIALLAGSQIVKSFATLNQTLKLTETKQKEYDLSLSSIESFTATIKNVEDEIERTMKNDSKLKVEEIKLKSELSVLNDAVFESNNYLLEQYLPLLRGLHKVVR